MVLKITFVSVYFNQRITASCDRLQNVAYPIALRHSPRSYFLRTLLRDFRRRIWRGDDHARRALPDQEPANLFDATSTRARGETDKSRLVSTVWQYFRCKTVQFCATWRESEMAEAPSIRNGTQALENARKNSFLNYKSAALQLSYAGKNAAHINARRRLK
jgi:hypothetical protein